MKLSAPVHILKHRARTLKRSTSITMTEALDQVARAEGFASWSLLQSKAKELAPRSREDILGYLNPGDLLLVAARPGLGKTVLALQILLQGVREGRPGFFFSLEYTPQETIARLNALDESFDPDNSLLTLDFSDDISSDYIIRKTRNPMAEGTLIAVDYLQLLDQQRHKPPLQKQIEDLKQFARDMKCVLIFISQIDRAYDHIPCSQLGLDSVKLPNPLDVRLFNKSVFVQSERLYM